MFDLSCHKLLQSLSTKDQEIYSQLLYKSDIHHFFAWEGKSFLYFFIKENYNHNNWVKETYMKIERKHYTLHTNKKITVKICHLSDLHFKEHYNLKILESICYAVQKEDPNYICITGDLLDDMSVESSNTIDLLYDFFFTIASISKVICILGNHDETLMKKTGRRIYKSPDRFIRKLKSIPNFHLLNNEVYENGNIRFIGYRQPPLLFEHEVRNEESIQQHLTSIFPYPFSKDRYNVFLSHSPIIVGRSAVQNNLKVFKTMDLILCGHMHNGLVFSWMERFYPPNRGIISPNKKWFPNQSRGILLDKISVIIHGGIIKLSGTSGIFQYLNGLYKPSFVVIQVKK